MKNHIDSNPMFGKFTANIQNDLLSEDILKKWLEHKKWFESQKSLTKTCWQRIHEVLQVKRSQPASFCEMTLLDTSYYYKAKNNYISPPDIRTIMAIAAGFDLGFLLTNELMSLAGHAFNPTSDVHDAYIFILNSMNDYSIDAKNLLLQVEGFTALGTNSK